MLERVVHRQHLQENVGAQRVQRHRSHAAVVAQRCPEGSKRHAAGGGDDAPPARQRGVRPRKRDVGVHNALHRRDEAPLQRKHGALKQRPLGDELAVVKRAGVGAVKVVSQVELAHVEEVGIRRAAAVRRASVRLSERRKAAWAPRERLKSARRRVPHFRT